MDINEMTKKQFEQVKFLEDWETVDIDSIVLLPTRKLDGSGYNIFYVIACKGDTPIGKCAGYDTFSIFLKDDLNRVGIDCLKGSGLMRIFLSQNKYVLKEYLHKVVKKGSD